jgi:hypothetical protein
VARASGARLGHDARGVLYQMVGVVVKGLRRVACVLVLEICGLGVARLIDGDNRASTGEAIFWANW